MGLEERVRALEERVKLLEAENLRFRKRLRRMHERMKKLYRLVRETCRAAKLAGVTPEAVALSIIERLQLKGKVAVIDGANLLYWGGMELLRAAIEWSRREGFRPIAVLSSDAYERLGEGGRRTVKKLKLEGLLYTIPLSVDDDAVIIELAERLDGIILSNDNYAEYWKRYPRLRERIYYYKIVNGKPTFAKLF